MTRFAMLFLCVLYGTAAAGPVENTGKDIAKGAVKGAKEEVKNGDVQSGAKEVSAGVVQGLTEHGKDLDKSLRDVSRSTAQGIFVEVRNELGSNGDGPLAQAVGNTAAATGRVLVRTVGEELARVGAAECQGKNPDTCVDDLIQRYTYDISKAAARGVAAGTATMTIVLAVGGGFAGGLLCAAIIAILLGQRRIQRKLDGMTGATAHPPADVHA